MSRFETITWDDFTKVELRAGTVVRAEVFSEARRPALKLWIDLGPLGIKRSSAQITELYQPEKLVGTQVLCVCNFPPKQIGPFMSEVLVTGLVDAGQPVVLVRPDRPVANGTRLG